MPGEMGQARTPVVSTLQGPGASAVPSGRSEGMCPAGVASRHPTPCPQPRVPGRGPVRPGPVGKGGGSGFFAGSHQGKPATLSESLCVFQFF